jgi:hypothetical protein
MPALAVGDTDIYLVTPNISIIHLVAVYFLNATIL